MNVNEIVKKYLDDNGYDGLCDGEIECGCGKDDLFPCFGSVESCKPAYKVACDHSCDGVVDYCYTTSDGRECPLK